MANRLAQETSPYLLQHAENPVDWHAWDPEALELARERDKPILLSIGYSACHWCHVMAHESFEDDETAQVMNRLFVNIKVDREERPDIDRIYQVAHQLFTGRPGGWPLTVFLTPDDHVPVFTGTYFPKDAKYGMPSFRDVLTRVESYFRTHGREIRGNGETLARALSEINARSTAASTPQLDRAPIVEARQRLADTFDNRNGGFGEAPKFPHSTDLALLLDRYQSTRAAGQPDGPALTIVTQSLNAMARRGLYDHLGGGFFRYSVDEEWAIPHFEKMLYDNAALLGLYADAYAVTREPLYEQVASETADWVLRDMRDDAGAFYATLDADSEGEEGRFYVWSREQFDELLDAEQRQVAKSYYGLDAPPNFEGRWHLHATRSIDDVASAIGTDAGRAESLLGEARRILFEARRQRVWPHRDEKRLAAWNGLMIGGLAKASRRLGRPELADAAAAAVDFIHGAMWNGGRLKATYKDGRARLDAYLDDYAFLGAGLLELMQCRFRSADLAFAQALADAMLEHFEDAERGGFFFTADDHERLIHRPKPWADEAIPSGNAVAAELLSDLGHLVGEQRYIAAAEKTVRAAYGMLEQYPEAHATLLRALERQVEPPELVVVRGPAQQLDAWRAAVDADYAPGRLSFFISSDLRDLPGLLAQRTGGDAPAAYVCSGLSCEAPIDDLQRLRERLQATGSSHPIG